MFIVYDSLSSKYHCGHIEGILPYRCENKLADCESKCTSFSWCVGYSTDGDLGCALISSSGWCPDGWSESTGPMATSYDDLIASNFSGFSCKVKVIGMVYDNGLQVSF